MDLIARKVFIFGHFRFLRVVEVSCSLELSMKKFYNLWTVLFLVYVLHPSQQAMTFSWIEMSNKD